MTAPSDNADNPTKNQHYVPQGYLRNFSIKDQIFAYDKSERRKFKPKRENEKIARMAQLTQSQWDGEAFGGPICSPCG